MLSTFVIRVVHCSCFSTVPNNMAIKKAALLLIVIVYGAVFVNFYIKAPILHNTVNQNVTCSIQSGGSLFNNDSVIRHCIKGDLIGVRSSVPLISFEKLAYHKEPEESQERMVSFRDIFIKKIWGSNRQVNFSASGSSYRMSAGLPKIRAV